MPTPSRNDSKIVLDTNVILFDAMAIRKFENADIHIPFSVIEEVDRFKRDMGENGRNARHFSRFVDVLRATGSLSDGVAIEGTGSYVYITIDQGASGLPQELDENKADNRILGTAITLQNQSYWQTPDSGPGTDT